MNFIKNKKVKATNKGKVIRDGENDQEQLSQRPDSIELRQIFSHSGYLSTRRSAVCFTRLLFRTIVSGLLISLRRQNPNGRGKARMNIKSKSKHAAMPNLQQHRQLLKVATERT